MASHREDHDANLLASDASSRSHLQDLLPNDFVNWQSKPAVLLAQPSVFSPGYRTVFPAAAGRE